MILFRPLIRYADFKGRASRGEYWGFGVLQGLWYALLVGLAVGAMGQSDHTRATAGVLVAFGVILISVAALIVPNYAVLTRRLHDSGRGAVWLCLMLPSVGSSVMTVGTIATAVGSVGLGASRDAFLGLALSGLGAAGLLGLVGMVCQGVLLVLTLMPGTSGENRFGSDPRGPSSRYDDVGGPTYSEARLEALFAEARRGTESDQPHSPVFDFGSGPPPRPRSSTDWAPPASSNGLTPAPTFGRRGA